MLRKLTEFQIARDLITLLKGLKEHEVLTLRFGRSKDLYWWDNEFSPAFALPFGPEEAATKIQEVYEEIYSPQISEEEVSRLQPGLYRILWRSGGDSLASVGITENGQRWLAPCNWVSGPSTDWSGVKCVQRFLSDS